MMPVGNHTALIRREAGKIACAAHHPAPTPIRLREGTVDSSPAERDDAAKASAREKS